MVAAGVSGAIFAAGVALFAWQLAASVNRSGSNPAEQRVDVLTCATSIKQGDVITSLNVAPKSVPKSLVPEGAILASRLASAKGRRAGVAFTRGEMLTEGRLAQAESPLDETRTGHTAVTVAVDPVRALGGEATPGMKVDLMVEETVGTVSVIAEGVRIISTSVRETPESSSSLMSTSDSPTVDIAWVTLEVPDQSVAAVVAASSAGSVYLVFPPGKAERPRG